MKDNSNMPATVKEVAILIWQISKFSSRGKQRMLDEFGLTSSQMEMLGAICHMSNEEEEVMQISLSQETKIDPMTTSTILRNLEKKGLITRKASKTDTRARVVSPTKKGQDLFAKAMEKMEKAQNVLFKDVDLNLIKEQLLVLLDALKKSQII